MSYYTPGPWHYHAETLSVGPRSDADDQSYGMIIGIADVVRGYEDHDANGVLLAAAPELLEALDGLVETLPTEAWEALPEYLQKECINALAKAKGVL